MKKIKKLSVILGVLLLGVIIMSSNVDAKKKKTKYIDLSKYVTVKVKYGEPYIAKYKKNNKLKYNGKKITQKQLTYKSSSVSEFNKFVKSGSVINYKTYKSKKVNKNVKENSVTRSHEPGKYIWEIVFKAKSGKNKPYKKYRIKKAYTVKEGGIYYTGNNRVVYQTEHYYEPECFESDNMRVGYYTELNVDARIDFKCDYTPNDIKIVDYNKYVENYGSYFKDNNINSNDDLRTFIYNKVKNIGEISYNKSFTLKNRHMADICVNIKEKDPNLYNKVNNVFGSDMFWKLVKPRITIKIFSKHSGKELKADEFDVQFLPLSERKDVNDCSRFYGTPIGRDIKDMSLEGAIDPFNYSNMIHV